MNRITDEIFKTYLGIPSKIIFAKEILSVLPSFRHTFCHTSEFFCKCLPGEARQNPRSAFFLVFTKLSLSKIIKTKKIITKVFLLKIISDLTNFLQYLGIFFFCPISPCEISINFLLSKWLFRTELLIYLCYCR